MCFCTFVLPDRLTGSPLWCCSPFVALFNHPKGYEANRATQATDTQGGRATAPTCYPPLPTGREGATCGRLALPVALPIIGEQWRPPPQGATIDREGEQYPDRPPHTLTGSPLCAALYPLGLMHPKGYEATGRPTGATTEKYFNIKIGKY